MKKKPARRPGRPSNYRPEFTQAATKLCLLGATDADLAMFFDVSLRTIASWKGSHPEFLHALKQGKQVADSNVATSLYRRATGYEHQAVKIFFDSRTNAEKVVTYTERYAPDTTAAIFWLKNRRPDLWRDRIETKNEHTVLGLEAFLRAVPAIEDDSDRD